MSICHPNIFRLPLCFILISIPACLAAVSQAQQRFLTTVTPRMSRYNQNDRQIAANYFDSSPGDSRTAEAALFQAIMGNYRSNVRPVRNINETVYISARLFPIKIQSLKERDEILSMTMRLQLGWSDLSLVWNPNDYGGLDKIVVNAYDLWLPDLQIANSAEDMYQLMRDRQFAVKIHNNGEIWWHPTGSVKVRCELDLRYFPFDFQRCPLTLESVIHTVQQLNLTVRQDRAPISFSMYTENGVWEMVLATGHTSSYYVSANTAFSRVNFLLYLHRRTSYYKLNIIFPCAMLSGLQLLTFLLPLNNQERVPQSTTILLSVVVFQTVVVEELPRTSNSLSLLSMYISLLTGISVASVADSVAIAYLISLRDRAFQVPHWLAVLIRCVCRNKSASAKKMPVRPLEMFNNNRSSLVVKSSLLVDQPSAAPLAFLDDHGEVTNRDRPTVGGPNGQVWSSRSRSQQSISALRTVKAIQCRDQPSAPEISNYANGMMIASQQQQQQQQNEVVECSLSRHSPLQTRRSQQATSTTAASSRKNSQTCPTSTAHEPTAAIIKTTCSTFQLKTGHEIVFVRWYKVARILNAIVFSICLLLIIFVPLILFVWLPPDATQYKYFKSPAAASPPSG